MKTKNVTQISLGFVASAVLLMSAGSVFALDGATRVLPRVANPTASTTIREAKLDAKMDAAKTRGLKEIDRRLTVLKELNEKVQTMSRVSADVKASTERTVGLETTSLTALRAKIEADTDSDALKTDVQSITESYRIFMLVVPQGHITVVADKIKFVAAALTTFEGKLTTRVNAAESAGKNVSAMRTSLADMHAKITDALSLADAAVVLVAPLTPDNGDKTKMESNKKAITDARAKIKSALEDIKAARKSGGSVADALKSLKESEATTTTTTTTR